MGERRVGTCKNGRVRSFIDCHKCGRILEAVLRVSWHREDGWYDKAVLKDRSLTGHGHGRKEKNEFLKVFFWGDCCSLHKVSIERITVCAEEEDCVDTPFC